MKTACIPRRKCAVVPNGLPPEKTMAPTDTKQRFGIPDDRLVMVMVARADPYKGIEFILDTLAAYLERSDIKPLHFLFVGDGDHLEHLREQSKSLGIDDHVTFAGYVTDAPSLIMNCDFAIHPSHGEVGYCLAILEYMRAGLPVIVPDNPSVCGATIDGKTGLIYADKQKDKFLNALITITENDNERLQMGINAAEHVKQFTLERAHSELIRIVDGCLANNGVA